MIAFETKSTQYKISILTIATHILLSIPDINSQNILCVAVRYTDINRQTLTLILVTLILTQYNKI